VPAHPVNVGSTPSRSRGTFRLRAALLLVVMAALLAACDSDSDTDSAEPQGSPASGAEARNPDGTRGGELTFDRAIEPATLDPTSGMSDAGTIQTQIQIFDQLTEILPGSDEVKPGLATSWKASKDGLTYTFELREARFSNGDPVTSADVVFSIERVLDPEIDPNFAPLFAFIESVEARGPKTVVFNLNEPRPALPAFLSFNVPSIVPKDYFEEVGAEEFAERPVGSGAFKLASFSRGDRLVLERNPHYWRKGLPYLDRVVMRYVPDGNTRILDIQSGSVDVADDIPFSQIDALSKAEGVNLVVRQISAIDTIYLNEKAKSLPLRETEVRQALNYATPREDIARVVYAGKAPVANSMIPKIKYWDEGVEPYPYDVEKARELIGQSSKPDGFPLELTIVGTDEVSKQVAQIVQDSWGEIGIDVSVRTVDFGTLNENFFGGDWEALKFLPTSSSSDVPIDDELVNGFLGADYEGFFTGWRNKPVQDLIADVLTETDESARPDMFSRIQQGAMDDPPFVPLVFTPGRAAYRDGVQGFDFVTTNWWRLDQVSLEER
jgi:peptide/nickel transport system substrate-binding protein